MDYRKIAVPGKTMKKWKHAVLFVSFSLLLFATATKSDIAPNPMSGGISLQVPGHENTDIVLVHNTVKLKITPSLCKTRVFFRLHNVGAATELDVGFPLIYKGEAPDFQIWIDNKAQKFEDREKEVTFNAGGRLRTSIQRWKVWRMNFEPNETQLVEVRYSNPPAASFSSVISTAQYPAYAKWRATGFDYNMAEFGYEKPIQLHEWLKIGAVQYILVTGSYWKGPIGRCRVEADIENLALDSLLEVRPPAKSFSSKQIVWEWQNIDPPRNVDITFIAASPRQTIIPHLEKTVAQHSDDMALSATLKALREDFPSDDKIKERQKAFLQSDDKK